MVKYGVSLKSFKEVITRQVKYRLCECHMDIILHCATTV